MDMKEELIKELETNIQDSNKIAKLRINYVDAQNLYNSEIIMKCLKYLLENERSDTKGGS